MKTGVLSLIFSAVVTLATAVYACLTWRLVSETIKMREVQTEPKMEISLRPFDVAINIQRLHIRNIGMGPALGVKFMPRVIAGGDAAQALIDELTKTNFFRTGLSYMGPCEERSSHYTQMTENSAEKSASVLAFDLEYQSATGKKRKETVVIDMSEYKGSYQLGKPRLYSIALSLEKIQKDVQAVFAGSRKIQANVYTSQDREDDSSASKN